MLGFLRASGARAAPPQQPPLAASPGSNASKQSVKMQPPRVVTAQPVAQGAEAPSRRGRLAASVLDRLLKVEEEFKDASSSNPRFFGSEVKAQLKALQRMLEDFANGPDDDDRKQGVKRLTSIFNIAKGPPEAWHASRSLW